jgi:site-specific DNA-cytosine methylase
LNVLEEYISYATFASSDLFGDVERISAWRDFIREAESTSAVIADIGIDCWRSVLPLAERLRGDTAPRRESRQEVAASLTSGSHPNSNAPGRDGTGRGTPLTIAIQGNMIGRAETAGPQGSGIDNSGGCFTLTKTDVHAIAFNARQTPINGPINGPIDTHGATQCVAFAQNQRDEVREMPIAGALAKETGSKQQTYAAQGMSVRRLTPRECERLQGFPTVIERVTITGCLDHQKTSVNVALQCRRLPSNALNAAGDESIEYVLPADFRLQNDRDLHDSLVALHVRVGFAPKLVALHSQGKWRLSADNAANLKWSHLLMPRDSFAHALVALWQGVEQETRNGKAELLPSTRSFTLPARGNWLAAMFGQESEGFANAVSGAQAEATTYITSNHGRDMQCFDWSDQTSRSFVLNVIASCIQKRTKPANFFNAVVDFETDYTLIQRNGKPVADGPRYKGLGNSMAVPVMHWLGKRISQCSALS